MVEKAITQQGAGPPGLLLSSLGKRERHNADGHKRVNILQFFSVLNSLSHTTLANKSEMYIFLKNS